MTLINIFEGDNIGSIASIEIANHTDFISLNPVQFIQDKSWQNIGFTGEAELKRKTKDDPNGVIYNYSGFFDIQSIRDEVELNLMSYVGKHAILRITDNNGRVYIIGQKGNPVTLEEDSTTGKLNKSKNGYQFNFSVSQTMAANSI